MVYSPNVIITVACPNGVTVREEASVVLVNVVVEVWVVVVVMVET
jgi:hypothetical protein